MRARPRTKYFCRKCGERIDFMPRPGFVPTGQPRYFPINFDDRKPHYARCKLTLELREAKSPSKPKKPRGAEPAAIVTPQREMFDATGTATSSR